MRPGNWNKYEVALLIEAYFECKGKKTKEKEIILNSLSRNLRQIGINRGIHIDTTYRNLSGMKRQMNCLIGIIEDKYKTIHKNLLFEKVYNIYLNNKSNFYMLLHDAYNMVDGKFDFTLLDNTPIVEEKELKISNKNIRKTNWINSILF